MLHIKSLHKLSFNQIIPYFVESTRVTTIKNNKIEKLNLFSCLFIFRTKKHINICFFAFSKIVIRLAQTELFGRKKIMKTPSNFDYVSITQSVKKREQKTNINAMFYLEAETVGL